ncbi:GlsB/YeaQ/YmgE family stress response membrane protein [Actinocorallia sp. API 0066]|uniref:GlsB/YeaQ/YmgE family stress response membrane protein n=1 Tax=Actinocorallia sp. API 0066 TaxID=2896846 RepID=UPI001E54B7D5|nr:GlsB/YeaQ/YmgE family stress response membrane protein [Actinocorallia sp. API 0066]MCD0453322.1 GlsB/YeaQ/YmgE family stress response membrane protein [Actinocorallia sp. API 0066]
MGGFPATWLFNVDGDQGFFDLTTWITAILGSVVLLFAYGLLTGRGGTRRSWRRSGRR